MKRPCLSVLIALLLCLLILPVLAENAAFETLPEQIQQLWLGEYAPEDFTDALTFALPDGQTCGLVLTKYGRLDGYFPQADAYEMQWSTHSLNGPGLRFVRHDASSSQPDGTPYPSSIGFDIVNDEGARMTFCYSESSLAFECVGYRRENSNYDVTIAPARRSHRPIILLSGRARLRAVSYQ